MSDETCRLLLVEDDPVLRKIYRQFLKLEGYDIEVASNGPAALALLDDRVPDIVIADVMMPGMDGPELCRAARTAHGDGFAFLFLTALDDLATLRRCYEAGADDYLVKDGSPDSLLRMIGYWRDLRAGRIAENERRPSLGDLVVNRT